MTIYIFLAVGEQMEQLNKIYKLKRSITNKFKDALINNEDETSGVV